MYRYKAELVRIIDGDTIVLNIDVGFDIWLKNQHVRLLGINTPEVRTRDQVEKLKGLAAASRVAELLNNCDVLEIQTELDKAGKYGRILATIYMGKVTEDEVVFESLNDVLVEEGHAVVY